MNKRAYLFIRGLRQSLVVKELPALFNHFTKIVAVVYENLS